VYTNQSSPFTIKMRTGKIEVENKERKVLTDINNNLDLDE